MTMESVSAQTDRGKAITELQQLTTKVLDGAAADTNIAVAGLGLDDTVQSCIMFAAGVPSNVTSEVVILTAGNIQLTDTNSTGNKLLLSYWRKPTPR